MLSDHPLYQIWASMRRRCRDEKNVHYKNYGGRGISICAAWLGSFEAFRADMEPTWHKGLTLERKDNNAGYSKENCKWADRFEQAANKRNNLWVETPLGPLIASAAERMFGLNRGTISQRLKRGWPMGMVLTPGEAYRGV